MSSNECDKVLSLEILKPYLELDLLLLLEKKKKAVTLKKVQPKFQPTIEIMCFMCKKLTSLDKILTMSCDHKFCMNCFREDCISKLPKIDLKSCRVFNANKN